MNFVQITVAEKGPNNPYLGRGSKMGYLIDGVSGAVLKLTSGKTYQFNVNAPGHPFMLSSNPKGAEGTKGSLMGSVEATDQGTIIFKVPSNYPKNSYYV